MKISDIAIKEVKCISPNATLHDVATAMRDYGVGVIPVCEGDKLIGLITDRDIVITCLAMGNDGNTCKASDFMTKNPRSVMPDMDLEEAARIMANEQVRRLPVTEGNNLVGMLSLGDISQALKGNDKLIADTLRKISTPTRSSKTH